MARSCEENWAIRAAYSKPRKLPQPVFAPPPSRAAELRELLPQLDSPLPVYRRLAETALKERDEELIADAIKSVTAEIARCQRNKNQLIKLLPNLYSHA